MTTGQFAALMLTLLVHTGALFYWGGTVAQMLKDHNRRLEALERREVAHE